MTSVKTYPMYETKLGKALFPGMDHFSRELQSYFSEMLVKHVQLGRPIDAAAICASLDYFTPQQILDSSPDWIEHQTSRWKNEQRPLIINAIQDFLVLGGLENRISIQLEFLKDLSDAGIEIQGMEVLKQALVVSGDWHSEFITWMLMGRPKGVRFLCGENCNKDRIKYAIDGAGFNTEQTYTILNGLVSYS